MEEIMTVKEVAKYLKLSKNTIYRMVDNDELPYEWFRGQLRFKRSRIDECFKPFAKEA